MVECEFCGAKKNVDKIGDGYYCKKCQIELGRLDFYNLTVFYDIEPDKLLKRGNELYMKVFKLRRTKQTKKLLKLIIDELNKILGESDKNEH